MLKYCIKFYLLFDLYKNDFVGDIFYMRLYVLFGYNNVI